MPAPQRPRNSTSRRVPSSARVPNSFYTLQRGVSKDGVSKIKELKTLGGTFIQVSSTGTIRQISKFRALKHAFKKKL